MSTKIQDLPTPPQPSDTPAEFNSHAFSLLGALPGFVAQTNALGAEVEQNAAAALAAKNAAGASQAAAHSDSDAAMGYRNEARAARDVASAGAAGAAQHKADAQAAAQRAEQSAASVDPIESTHILAASLQDFFAQCLAKGSGFYRADGENIPLEMRYCPGWFSKTLDTWSFIANKYDTGRPVFFSGRFEDIPTGTWKQYDPMSRVNHTGTQDIGTVAGLEFALERRVSQTATSGAAVLPEGKNATRPGNDLVTGPIPAAGLVVRGNTESVGEYKVEFWDRVAGAWREFADRTWVGQQIAAIQTWVNQQITTAVGSVYIYPNGGTQAAPANVALYSRYVNANPFPGKAVHCQVQLRVNGVWGGAGGYIYGNGGGVDAGYGILSRQYGDEIITQTGSAALATASHLDGNPFGFTTNMGSFPCRVLVTQARG